MRGLRLALVVSLVASCGRIDFDVDPGAGSGSAVPGTFVRSEATGGNNHSPIQVPIVIDSGALIAVAAAECCGSSPMQMITSITDDGGNTYVSTGAIGTSTASTTEIWYTVATQPATTVSFTFGNSGTYAAVFVAELGGVDTLDSTTTTDNGSSSDTVNGATIDVNRPGEVVFSAIEIDVNHLGLVSNPFTQMSSVGEFDRQGCGYVVAGTAGPYTAEWQVDNSALPTSPCASSTAVFE